MTSSLCEHLDENSASGDSDDGDVLAELKPRVSNAITAFRKLFSDAQRSAANHAKCANLIHQQLSRNSKLLKEFFLCIDRVLVVFKREPSVERLVLFIAQFTILPQNDGESDLCSIVLEHLLARSTSSDKAVRFRSCQILAAILNSQGDNADLTDEQWEDILEKMVLRLRDKVPLVRMHACMALKRLQDHDEDGKSVCPVTTEILRAMKSDISKDVRKAALQSVLINKAVLPSIIHRVRDTSEDVRCTAYKVLGAKVGVKHLTVPQRIALIEWGLKDRCRSVVSACKDLICQNWAKKGIIPLLKLLDVTQFEEAAESITKLLIETGLKAEKARTELLLTEIGLNQETGGLLRGISTFVVDFAEGLTPESALFVRIQAESIGKDKEMTAAEREDRLAAVLPETSNLCAFMEALHSQDNLEEQPTALYILQQLLKMSCMVDFSEESGRQRLVLLLKSILLDPNTPTELIEVTMRALAAANPAKGEFARVMIELINDITDMDDMTSNDNSIKDDENENSKIDETHADESNGEELAIRQIRSLEMAAILLEYTSRTLADGNLGGLDKIILEAVKSPFGALREIGVCTLGKYALLGEQAAKSSRLLLITAASNSHEELPVRGHALQAVFDLALIYGDAFLNHDDQAGLNLLYSILGIDPKKKKECPALVAIGAEGCAKLMHGRKLFDSQLLGRLISMYFIPGSPADPNTLSELVEQEERNESEYSGIEGFDSLEQAYQATALGSPIRLQQVLTTFFSCYVDGNPLAVNSVKESIPYVLKDVIEAEKNSVGDIPVQSIFRFLVSLLQTETSDENKKTDCKELDIDGESSSMHIACCLISSMLEISDSVSLGSLLQQMCRTLAILNPSGSENQNDIKFVIELGKFLKKYIKEKNSIKAINKFLDTWETFDKSPDVRLPQNQWISLTKNFGIPTDLRVISGSTEIIEPEVIVARRLTRSQSMGESRKRPAPESEKSATNDSSVDSDSCSHLSVEPDSERS